MFCGLGPGLSYAAVCVQCDLKFAKDQLILLLREWFIYPNG